jgi:CRISPR-associated protein Cas1
MLYRAVFEAILAVGLEPAFGYLHTPRSSAHPLVMDVLELFRVSVWDIVAVSSINRKQWNAESDFAVTKEKVWLSRRGQKKGHRPIWKGACRTSGNIRCLTILFRGQRTMELEVRTSGKRIGRTPPGCVAQSRIR